jgi:hypothetical protein
LSTSQFPGQPPRGFNCANFYLRYYLLSAEFTWSGLLVEITVPISRGLANPPCQSAEFVGLPFSIPNQLVVFYLTTEPMALVFSAAFGAGGGDRLQRQLPWIALTAGGGGGTQACLIEQVRYRTYGISTRVYRTALLRSQQARSVRCRIAPTRNS